MIQCSECGMIYEPMTDSYTCPCCGESNWPDEQEEDDGP